MSKQETNPAKGYRKKEYNLDTIEVNAMQTSRVLGVHAPIQVQLPIFSLGENYGKQGICSRCRTER